MEQWDVHAHACMDMEASMGCIQMLETDLINWIEDRMQGGKQKNIKQCKTRYYSLCGRAQAPCGRAFGLTELLCLVSSLLCSLLVVYIEVLG